MSNLAIIPARGGSKRIPRKNIKVFNGKPIIAYSIEAAIRSGLFDEVMVSTDDNEIAEVAKRFGASVPFMRSEKNSNDFAGLADVCIEVINKYKESGNLFEITCCILPTAPFVSSEKLINANNFFDKSYYDSVFTVVEYSYPIQRSLKIDGDFVKMRWPENFPKRSQDLEKTYHDAGQFYLIKTDVFLKDKMMFVEKSGAIILNEIEVQDIDTEVDWKLAELKYQLLKKEKKDCTNEKL
jgi:pseudaminic acid cytidylyltransferase